MKVTKDKTKVTVTSESEMSKRCARGVLPARHSVRKLVGEVQAWVCVCLYCMPWQLLPQAWFVHVLLVDVRGVCLALWWVGLWLCSLWV